MQPFLTQKTVSLSQQLLLTNQSTPIPDSYPYLATSFLYQATPMDSRFTCFGVFKHFVGHGIRDGWVLILCMGTDHPLHHLVKLVILIQIKWSIECVSNRTLLNLSALRGKNTHSLREKIKFLIMSRSFLLQSPLNFHPLEHTLIFLTNEKLNWIIAYLHCYHHKPVKQVEGTTWKWCKVW